MLNVIIDNDYRKLHTGSSGYLRERDASYETRNSIDWPRVTSSVYSNSSPTGTPRERVLKVTGRLPSLL